jgi:hypothetical protein
MLLVDVFSDRFEIKLSLSRLNLEGKEYFYLTNLCELRYHSALEAGFDVKDVSHKGIDRLLV